MPQYQYILHDLCKIGAVMAGRKVRFTEPDRTRRFLSREPWRAEDLYRKMSLELDVSRRTAIDYVSRDEKVGKVFRWEVSPRDVWYSGREEELVPLPKGKFAYQGSPQILESYTERLATILRSFDEATRRFVLSLQRLEKTNLRLKHTNDLREFARAWQESLGPYLRIGDAFIPLPDSASAIAEIEENPLFEDLRHHLPRGVDPYAAWRQMKKHVDWGPRNDGPGTARRELRRRLSNICASSILPGLSCRFLASS